MAFALKLDTLADRLPRSPWSRFAAPAHFYALAGRLLPWCWAAALVFGLAGFALGLLVAPPDAEQGDAYRIVFVHVPAAAMSLLIYAAMAVWAALGLLLGDRLAPMMAAALVPTGALMAFIALWTGSLWGKPAWGSWWVWDARLTAEMLLLGLYLGFIALQAAIDDRQRAARAGALLTIVGAVGAPSIYVGLAWWHALHPGAIPAGPGPVVLTPAAQAGLLLMTAALWAWSIAAALHRVRSIILERERASDWVRQLGEAR